jgi:hypothetical protein
LFDCGLLVIELDKDEIDLRFDLGLQGEVFVVGDLDNFINYQFWFIMIWQQVTDQTKCFDFQ